MRIYTWGTDPTTHHMQSLGLLMLQLLAELALAAWGEVKSGKKGRGRRIADEKEYVFVHKDGSKAA